MKTAYKVILNWKGELHILYTSSFGKSGALNNAIYQLADKLNLRRGYVKLHFSGKTDNFQITERSI